MKRILFWKYLDLVGQGVMVLPMLFLVAAETRENSFLTYFTVGGWQVLSWGIQAAFSPLPVSDGRRKYGKLLTWIISSFAITAGLCWLCGNTSDYGSGLSTLSRALGSLAALEAFALLFLGPVMAVWYACITADDIAAIRHRQEIHWKL